MTYNWVDPENTPYSFYFPKANLAHASVEIGVYNYLLVEDDAIHNLGLGSEDAFLIFTDAQKFMQFPFSYGDEFEDTFEGTTEVGGLTSYFDGRVTVKADGWGSLGLPDHYFANALRIYTHEIRNDSIDLFGVAVVSYMETHRFMWAIPGYPGPIATYNQTSGYAVTYVPGFPPDTTTLDLEIGFEYDPLPFSTGINDQQMVASLDIVPNPVEDAVRFRVEQTGSESLIAEIIDGFGRILTSESLDLTEGRSTYSLNVPESARIYYLVLRNAKGVTAKPFVVR